MLGRNITETNEATDIVTNTTLGLPILFIILRSTSYALSAYTCSEKDRRPTVPVHTRRLSDVVKVCRAIYPAIWDAYADGCLLTRGYCSGDDHRRETGPTINPPSTRPPTLAAPL